MTPSGGAALSERLWVRATDPGLDLDLATAFGAA